MKYSLITVVWVSLLFQIILHGTVIGQVSIPDEGVDEEVYYAGVNIVAPFTMIAPFIAADMPLVPEASCVIRGN